MRIAIIGGTFDSDTQRSPRRSPDCSLRISGRPVHFVPAYSAPHKQSHDSISAYHRFAMVGLATSPYEGFRVSAVEVEAQEKRYTVDTLERMRAGIPDAIWFLSWARTCTGTLRPGRTIARCLLLRISRWFTGLVSRLEKIWHRIAFFEKASR